MIVQLLKAASRFYRRRPLQLVLALAGVSLGVAVFVGVELANDSARRAFEESRSLLAGRATHQLIGVGSELPSRVYRDLRVAHGPLTAAPVVEARARVATPEGDMALTLLGIDPFEERDFRDYAGSTAPATGSAAMELLTTPASVLLPAFLSRELGIDVGDTLELSVDRRPPAVLMVVGILAQDRYDSGGINLPLVADIATVEALRGLDTITRIDLVLTDAEAETLRALDLPGTALVPAASRDDVFDALTRAFRINLTALSLLALLVGVFLIYATMSFAVLQRRGLFGIYRALGLRRGQLLLVVLLEALVLGGVATVFGVVIGALLSRGLVDLMLRTIGDLYFATAVRAVAPSPAIYVAGFVVGVGMSLAAALVPALEAGGVAPHNVLSRATLERAAARLSRRGATLAVPVVATGLVVLAAAPRSLVGAFLGLFLVILGAAFVIPSLSLALLRGVEPLVRAGFGPPGSLAIRGVAGSMSRTGVAVTALAVAVATVVGVGLMIDSFRGSVVRWLDATLLADLYADVETWNGDEIQRTLTAVAAIPGVRGLSTLRYTRVPTDVGEVSLRAVEPGPDGWGLTLVSGNAQRTLRALAAGDGVLLTESLAYRAELAPGDDIVLPTASGPVAFRVLGLYREYNTDGGGVLMAAALYRARWQDRELDGLGIYLEPGADAAAVATAVQAQLSPTAEARVRSTAAIRQRSLEVFDRTFRITEVLRILAGTVAFLGLLSALLAIELDRTKEIAILRAIGFDARQVGILSLTQTGLLGLAAGLLAVPLGLTMAGLLVNVINRRSFGWGMDLAVTPQPLLLGIGLAVLAALMAGVYPAIRLSRSNVVAALREE